jgi:hypothetical protein
LWCTAIILALEKLRQENHQLVQVCLGYIVRPCQVEREREREREKEGRKRKGGRKEGKIM